MEEKVVRITEDEGVVKTVHQDGSGDLPKEKNIVHVHYELFVADKLLDSNLKRGEPLPVTIGEGGVIRGWELALSTMKLNEKATVVCKPEYAYGALGSPPQVPPNATLRFEMEIVKIERPPTTATELIPIANAIKEEGNKFYTEKKYAEAFAKYEKALDVFRHMFPKEDEERAKVNAVKSVCLSNQAACKIQEQDWKLAKVCCESALDLDENAVKAIYRRGQCFVGLGEFERGFDDYKRALELDPKNAMVPKLIEEAKKKQQNYNKKSKAMYSKMFASEDKEK